MNITEVEIRNEAELYAEQFRYIPETNGWKDEKIKDFTAGYNAALQKLKQCSVRRWVACSERMPDYDGMYVVFIHQPQPCGNVWQYQRIVENVFNRWVLEDENEEVRYWSELLPPPIA